MKRIFFRKIIEWYNIIRLIILTKKKKHKVNKKNTLILNILKIQRNKTIFEYNNHQLRQIQKSHAPHSERGRARRKNLNIAINPSKHSNYFSDPFEPLRLLFCVFLIIIFTLLFMRLPMNYAFDFAAVRPFSRTHS